MEYAIEVKDICKEYKNFKLDHVSFSVPKGCIVGFVGENGAGKSTTIKAILNLIRTTSGTITLLGENAAKENPSRNEDVGIVFDSCHFPEYMKVQEVESILANLYANWQKDTFSHYADLFSLPWDKPIKEFSRGMKMKLSIAAALSHKAKLLILDEATSGLDPMIREQILDLFLDFIQEEDHSILVSSHIISDLEKVADYIVFIHKGKIVFSKSKDDLRYNYGIVKCSEDQYQKLPEEHVIGVRKNNFGYEVLVDNRPELERHAHSFVIDPASIEDIILYQTRGGAA